MAENESLPSGDRSSMHITEDPMSLNPMSLNPNTDSQNTKIEILLNAAANAPIMKKRKWVVDQEKTISSIMGFIHKYLKLDPEEKIFLYVNQTFAPSPDQIVKNLYECHGANGKLVLYYCKNQAWG